MRWFFHRFTSNTSSIKEISCLQKLSDVQLLVALCKSLGLRTRLVLVFKPAPLKITKQSHPSKQNITSKKSTFSAVVDEYQYTTNQPRTNQKSKRKRKQTASPYFDITSSPEGEAENKKRKLQDDDNDCYIVPTFLYDQFHSWAEVLLPGGKWRPLHIPSMSVGQPALCEKHVPNQFQYVLAFEHSSQFCDVTPRYASQWCTKIHKMRVDSAWWHKTLASYSPPDNEAQLETNDIKDQLLLAPLPTILSHYKNHPLYALKTQLLKYEAIYPEDNEHILGHYKGEPVYSRSCVQTLHTRESWLKEGLVVKQGESPFKIVKAKRSEKANSEQKDSHLFGHWQTEQYIPPPVVDGRVPRNEYGNVELFTSSMLPKGAVHLTLSGINRVAQKLGIDYAPAMKGWEFTKGACYPIFDGIVVASEYEDILIEAWQQHQQVYIEKDIEKRHKVILDRWAKLTNSLLIQERVKQRYKQSNNYS